ncbi:MAG TPA: hypothetical protein VER58_08555 [Thermoanaerobaculia bacterium]|nr:hypothetical protein [Thermoanaerobaculia bacterium]
MPTLMQKIRLAIRGWSRRREEKEREFLAKNAWGGAPPTPAAASPARSPALHIDIDGLTVAYLDGSGQMVHYLDIETGEVIDTGDALTGGRYRRIPSQSEAADRQAFIEAQEDSGTRARLRSGDFRAEIARDRAVERAWYNFRNDRAIAAIEKWLRENGVK